MALHHQSSSSVFFTLCLSGILLLQGCTSTVATLTGSNQVGAHLGDRTFSQRLRDDGVETTALVNLYKLDKRFKSDSRLDVVTFHDAVLLTGQVPDVHLKNLATDNVQSIREVKVVHNELEVGAQASYTEIVKDSIIKGSITKDLTLAPNLKESRVKVVVERGVVYLMGILSDAETKQVLEVVQKTGAIKKIVSLIDRLEDVENEMNTRPQASATKRIMQPSLSNQIADKTTKQGDVLLESSTKNTTPDTVQTFKLGSMSSAAQEGKENISNKGVLIEKNKNN